MPRAFTTLGAGVTLLEAYQAARSQGGPIEGTNQVRLVDVPAGVNPSKVGTWVQRLAQDPEAGADVPEEHREVAAAVAADLRGDPATCLAMQLDGDLAARTRARAGAPEDAGAYLLFGLAED